MIRLDLHKYRCSFYQKRDNVLRQLHRELVASQDSFSRYEIICALRQEYEYLASPGRLRHPCFVCLKIARMRTIGLDSFLQNFDFESLRTKSGNRAAPAENFIHFSNMSSNLSKANPASYSAVKISQKYASSSA